jgi:hypothetical protein
MAYSRQVLGKTETSRGEDPTMPHRVVRTRAATDVSLVAFAF